MSIKVLVADDSITIQKVIGIIFGGSEYSLTVVDNGKSAVDKAREIDPDILLIDALMPGMTGYEVSETIRSIPALAAKPILILTGSFEPFDEEKAKKCGADDFIAKPFESQQIIAKVNELLELGRTRVLSTSQPAPVYSVPSVETPQPDAPADIWGAFTTEAEQLSEPVPAAVASASNTTAETDVFAIVTEETDAELVQPIITTESQPTHTGSQWVPVEENTFEFEEKTPLEYSKPVFTEQAAPVQEATFGDVVLENAVSSPEVTSVFTEQTTDVSAFNESPEFESAPNTENFASLPTNLPASLTEEQLKAAIMAASKEVIERIVWEVVPDLAEAMIRDAIRKIKEGI